MSLSSGERYNTCLFNLYRNGEEAMGWQSDDELELKKRCAIALVGLGRPGTVFSGACLARNA